MTLSTDVHKTAAQLYTETVAFLAKRAAAHRHQIACGILQDNGDRIFGINIVSNLGPASVCAEQITLGESLKAQPQPRVTMVVTVRALFTYVRPHEIVSPCGRCREILYEYAPAALVVLPELSDAEQLRLTPVSTLLPHPFYRRVASDQYSNLVHVNSNHNGE